MNVTIGDLATYTTVTGAQIKVRVVDLFDSRGGLGEGVYGSSGTIVRVEVTSRGLYRSTGYRTGDRFDGSTLHLVKR